MNLYRYNNKPIKGTKENEKCILLKLFIPPESKTGQNKDLIDVLNKIGKKSKKDNFVEVIRSGTSVKTDKLQWWVIYE